MEAKVEANRAPRSVPSLLLSSMSVSVFIDRLDTLLLLCQYFRLLELLRFFVFFESMPFYLDFSVFVLVFSISFLLLFLLLFHNSLSPLSLSF